MAAPLALAFVATISAERSARAADVTDPYTPVTRDSNTDHIRSRIGMAFSLGGGVMNFTDSRTNRLTNPGGEWTARLTLGTRSMLGLEGAYIGTANGIDGLGTSNNAALVSNGAEGLLRLNLTTFFVQPYVFGGVAWKRYKLVNNDSLTSSVRDHDDVTETPFGGGFSLMSSGFIFDARFTYRPTFDEQLFADSNTHLDNWDATGRVGFEF